uniref:Uncharacterized protein n=1 Tax=Anguilla anguilla TaxID=7936 RepID=A0A0E9QMT2_ANGAN
MYHVKALHNLYEPAAHSQSFHFIHHRKTVLKPLLLFACEYNISYLDVMLGHVVQVYHL